jgi:hypothetical protein
LQDADEVDELDEPRAHSIRGDDHFCGSAAIM